jgi:hypothetical protein
MSPVPEMPDADAIAAAVSTCQSVSGVTGGLAGEVATYLPGRRVAGIRVNPGSVEVHVVARYGSTPAAIFREVRAAVAAAVPGPVQVDVVVADVEDPFAVPDELPPPALGAGPSIGASALPAAPAP